jgi:pSer/pThr/pTyr-binding forkhead associated (FHA) protein
MKVITIGRNEAHNDIVVHDNKVSRNHLQMIMDDSGNFSVMDLNSTNGTYVNDRRIVGEVPLKVTD